MRYILHYTNPGDVVYDGFCGSGMTGVAAQLCGKESAVRELLGIADISSSLGARKAILSDLAPAATFTALSYNYSAKASDLTRAWKRIYDAVKEKWGWLLQTKHNDQNTFLSLTNCMFY